MSKKNKGTIDRPRISVFRSNKHIYAQVIDDTQARTLIACSTLDSELKGILENTGNIQASYKVGELIGHRLLGNNIKKVVFDRGGRPYHGRIKALAEGIREVGIIF